MPQDTVEETLREFKEALNVEQENNADLLFSILDRSEEIFLVKKKLARKRELKMKRNTYMSYDLKSSVPDVSYDDNHPSESDALLQRMV
jgi:hypothetical protein